MVKNNAVLMGDIHAGMYVIHFNSTITIHNGNGEIGMDTITQTGEREGGRGE